MTVHRRKRHQRQIILEDLFSRLPTLVGQEILGAEVTVGVLHDLLTNAQFPGRDDIVVPTSQGSLNAVEAIALVSTKKVADWTTFWNQAPPGINPSYGRYVPGLLFLLSQQSEV